ncbi:MAG: NTP transferase domain-containing protein [Nitrospirales bacterium]|nr:NTP transferase domain-containing protein [Nitrospira sp.]MDR4499883.1 NTP transferase domain-containing protein [Nitrospirales bacterium]
MTYLPAVRSSWSIILAGGEGERLRPSIKRWIGYPLPKQYCTFVGTRSMLQHTWDRADRLTPSKQKVTVVARDHWQQSWPQLKQHANGRLLLQPQNRDTGAGIFLALTYVRFWNPQATVAIFPSDHFVYPESRFLEMVRRALRATEILQDRIILLGSQPMHLELDYGWIEMKEELGWSSGSSVRQVKTFLEKPDATRGITAMSNGALWNTLVMAVKAETLWKLGWRCFPDLMERFEELGTVIGTPSEGPFLDAIYRAMPSHNFSTGLLQQVPESVGVMELQDVLWSDWERPERISSTLELLGKKPTFPVQDFSEPHYAQHYAHV